MNRDGFSLAIRFFDEYTEQKMVFAELRHYLPILLKEQPMKRIFTFLTIYLMTLPLLFAQLSEKGTPTSFSLTSADDVKIPTKLMTHVPMNSLHLEDEREEREGLPPRFGYPFQVNFNLNNTGAWLDLPNGERLWRLKLESPGALSINLLFNKFRIPEGGKFFVYSADRKQVLGAFTRKNVKSDGRFGTGLVFGDKVILEYLEPKNRASKSELEVGTVVHGYRYINYEVGKNYGDAAACEVDVNCASAAGREDQVKSVALMLIGGIRWCTGALINNVDEDCTPLFLTSNSCMSSYDAVDNPKATGFTFYWRYESPTCGGGDGSIYETTNGAVVLANSSNTGTVVESDFALLELLENPADNYDVYFAGWDASSAAPINVFSIHHPLGDVKKISEDDGALVSSAFPVFGGGVTHWGVFNWESGIMESGSIGAPLFLSSNKRIVGQHSGGLSNCGAPYEDYFGKFSYSWLNNGATDPRRRLKDWLDPSNIGLTAMDGVYSPCNPRPILAFETETVNLQEATLQGPDCLGFQEIFVDLDISAAPQVPIEVKLSFAGSALEGAFDDYEVTPKTVIFPAGSSASQTISIKIFDDAYAEGNEDFVITYDVITSGRGVSSLSENTFYGFIADDDLPPSLAGAVNTFDILFEDFEGGGFPSDWSKSTNGVDSLAFKWGTAPEIGDPSSFFTVNPMNMTHMVGSNDDVCNCDMSEDYLFSPVFDLSPSTYGQARVIYDVYFEDLSYQGFSEYAELYATDDNGATWVKVDNIPGVGADGPWQTRTADISDFVGSPAVQLRFRYTDSGGFLFGVAFDNIHVEVDDRFPANIQVLDNFPSMDEEYLGPFETVYFYDVFDGQLMLKIENTGPHDYGCTSVVVDRSGAPYAANEFSSPSIPYFLASKTFLVTPMHNNANGSYDITLYYTEEEVAGWEAITGQDRANAQIIKANTSIGTITPANFQNYTIENQTQTMVSYTNGSLAIDQGFKASFNTGFSGFGLGLVDLFLPVSLVSFEGEVLGQTAALSWEMSMEVDVDFFRLERSSDGINFSLLAEVDAVGNSLEPTSYLHYDSRPEEGVNYYRLSQIGLDGQLKVLEPIVQVYFGELANFEISPNPVKEHLDISFLNDLEEAGFLYLYDIAGREMSRQAIEVREGQNDISLDLSTLSSGVYFVQLQFGFSAKARRFIKE